MKLNQFETGTRCHYPFLLGSTSYVIPDDFLPNVRRLAPLVEDMELALFETPTASNMPTAAVVRELTDEHKTGFTVHLPTAAGPWIGHWQAPPGCPAYSLPSRMQRMPKWRNVSSSTGRSVASR